MGMNAAMSLVLGFWFWCRVLRRFETVAASVVLPIECQL